MGWPPPVELVGPHARLVPLAHEHAEGLREAVRDGEIWRLWYTTVPSPDGMDAEIERRLRLRAAGSMLPWTVLDATDRIVGMTTFMNIEAEHRHVEIGSTWYAQRVQRTPLNKVGGSCVYLPKSNSAWGFFPGTSVGGRIELTIP